MRAATDSGSHVATVCCDVSIADRDRTAWGPIAAAYRRSAAAGTRLERSTVNTNSSVAGAGASISSRSCVAGPDTGAVVTYLIAFAACSFDNAAVHGEAFDRTVRRREPSSLATAKTGSAKTSGDRSFPAVDDDYSAWFALAAANTCSMITGTTRRDGHFTAVQREIATEFFLPVDFAVSCTSGKLSAANDNAFSLKISRAAKTGLFSGSFSIFTENGTRLRKSSVPFNGVFVNGTNVRLYKATNGKSQMFRCEPADVRVKNVSSDGKYLQAAWDAMGENYVEEVLGIGPEKISAFRDAVLE